jgi:hypothetical protein
MAPIPSGLAQPPTTTSNITRYSTENSGEPLNLPTCPEHQLVTTQDTQGDTQTAVNPSDDLSQVVIAWPRLAAPLKAAIVAIVKTASAQEAQ